MVKKLTPLQRISRTQSESNMKIEVNSAADFLMSLLRVRQKVALTESQLQNFRGNFADVLMAHYQRHWYPELPARGSGYRCIRINGKMDPLVEQAGNASGLNSRTLRKMLPQELTMWIDPDEVSYRIGENGSVCVLYDSRRASPSSDFDSTGSDDFSLERIGRIEISNDLKELLLYEADTSFVTRPRSHRKNYNRHHHHHNKNHNNQYNSNNMHNNNHSMLQQQHQQQQQQLNNSVSSVSSSQQSPPLSPNNVSSHYQQFSNNFSSPQRQTPSDILSQQHQTFSTANWETFNNVNGTIGTAHTPC